MTKKPRGNLAKLIIKSLLVIPAICSLTNNLIALVKLEAACMRNRIIWLVVLAAFSFTLFMTFWLCLNAMLYLYLLSINISMVGAWLLLALFNFLILVITSLCIALINIDASFPETRKAIEQIFSK